MRGVQQAVALRLAPGALQIRLANGFEEGLAFLLETVQATASGGTGKAYFDRQVEYQGQVRAQVALNELLQGSDTFDRQTTATP